MGRQVSFWTHSSPGLSAPAATQQFAQRRDEEPDILIAQLRRGGRGCGGENSLLFLGAPPPSCCGGANSGKLTAQKEPGKRVKRFELSLYENCRCRTPGAPPCRGPRRVR